MGAGSALRSMGLVLFMSVAGLIGFPTTDAFAVAGKMTSAPPGVALSGGSLTLELEEPLPDGKTEITVPVSQQGEFDVPAGVDEHKTKRCRYTNDKGETTTFRCGGYLAFGSGAVATTASGWASTTERATDSWTFDALFAFGGSTSLGSTDATTTASVPGAQRFTSGLGGLAGATSTVMFRAHLPLKLTGPLGDVWGYFRWNEHINRSAAGGEGDVHPAPGNDVSTSFKRGRDLEVGVGKSFSTFCRNGFCQYFGIHVGASFQQNEITVSWNEGGGGGGLAERVSNQVWQTSFVTGAWYQFPLANLGPDLDRLSAIFGVDFRRIPNMNVNGQSSTFGNFSYLGSIDPWEVTTWAGLGMAF